MQISGHFQHFAFNFGKPRDLPQLFGGFGHPGRMVRRVFAAKINHAGYDFRKAEHFVYIEKFAAVGLHIEKQILGRIIGQLEPDMFF
ncbi:hypothetical protein SDC9_155754 [bioreactor metagenome]|uniref:Uncharacterized protein n=1 Tax=bioreactor metagenome TaxID=1076179 RepID=A0A645F4M8_9ZZZZ